MSETNVKPIRLGVTKWTYHKELSFASKYFTFSKILLQFKNLLHRVNLMVHNHTFRKQWSFICGCYSSMSILKAELQYQENGVLV